MYRRTSWFVALALVTKAFATKVTTDTSVAANQTFDYVIVGGGLSGITVGNKVSDKRFPLYSQADDSAAS